jgi:hypothetical protein
VVELDHFRYFETMILSASFFLKAVHNLGGDGKKEINPSTSHDIL